MIKYIAHQFSQQVTIFGTLVEVCSSKDTDSNQRARGGQLSLVLNPTYICMRTKLVYPVIHHDSCQSAALRWSDCSWVSSKSSILFYYIILAHTPKSQTVAGWEVADGWILLATNKPYLNLLAWARYVHTWIMPHRVCVTCNQVTIHEWMLHLWWGRRTYRLSADSFRAVKRSG